MGGITLEGKLLMMERDTAFEGENVVRFLKHHALGQIGGKLLMIRGGSPIHRAEALKEFLKDEAAASGAARTVARLHSGVEP
jgi:hypothetical protein